MASRLRILRGSNEGATFDLGTQFIRIGSDSGGEIRLSGTGIPSVALILEVHAPTKSYRIHDRTHGRLLLGGEPLTGSSPTPWNPSLELSIDDVVTLILEDASTVSDAAVPMPPPLPGRPVEPSKASETAILTESAIRRPPLGSTPAPAAGAGATKSPAKGTNPKDSKRPNEPAPTTVSTAETPEPAFRLASSAAVPVKNKTLEMIQMLTIIVLAGIACWGILFFGTETTSSDQGPPVRSFERLSDELWKEVEAKRLPVKYMDTLQRGRSNEKQTPRQTLESYLEMKQDILVRQKEPRYVANSLDEPLLNYLSHRIGVLQQALTKKKK